MYLKSPFPQVPPLPEKLNVHSFLFDNPQHPLSQDYRLQIDGISGRVVTRDEFIARARDGATALRSPLSEGGLGIGSQEDGEIVGIFSHNSLDYVTLVHSLLVNATPFALLSAYATPFELAGLIRTAKVTRIFAQGSLLQNATKAAQEVGIPEDHVYAMEERKGGRKSYAGVISEVRQRGLERAPVKLVHKDTLAYFVFSSGTTGLPKAVMVSHGNICFSMLQVDVSNKTEGRGITIPPPVALAFLPMYHSYGLHTFCFRGIWSPMTYLIMPRWDVDQAMKLIPKYRVNVLFMIPSAIHQMMHHTGFKPKDLASVMSILSGAAYLPPTLVQRLEKAVHTNLAIGEGYGMSEVTISATRGPSVAVGIPPVSGTVGILLPGMEARIVREDGSEAEAGEPGELWLRGENVVKGYWENEKATREAFTGDGWLKTGDWFKVDELGRLFFVERVKDTLKVSGLQVSPGEIEEVLLAHPERLAMDVCVAGVSGGRTSDEKNPRAWVVLSEEGKQRGAQAALEALDKWVKESLSKYKWLRGGIEAVDKIPKLPTGKVLRRTLVDQHEQRTKQPRARL